MTEFLENADRIGSRICRDALWSGNRCNWTGDDPGGRHLALGANLYSGAAGVALFLARLHRLTGERIHQVTAVAAARSAWARLDALPPLTRAGYYVGAVGAACACWEIVGSQAIGDLERLAAIPDGPSQMDLMGGSPGAIPGLLWLWTESGDPRLLNLAAQHGDVIVQAAERTEAGCSWKTIEASRNLTGFSHGAAGIAWALLELWSATGEAAYRDAALEAFRYERSCFDLPRQNWPDYRGANVRFTSYWCHGAGGIALSRLRAWELLGSPELLTEANLALAATRAILKLEGAVNFCLCHGRAGNAAILLLAAEMLNDPSWRAAAAGIALDGIERYEQKRIPWPCGASNGLHTPNLMCGLAGVGMLLLDLAGQAMPSVILPGYLPAAARASDERSFTATSSISSS